MDPAAQSHGIGHEKEVLQQQVSLDLPAAVRMATLTPATILGLQDDIGSLAAGKRAYLLLLDADLNIRSVFVAGEAVTLEAS